MLDIGALAGSFFAIFAAIFVAELTDKDALLLLSLATRMRPLLVFVAGSVAFTITTAVIVVVGSALVVYVPILWIKVAGGVIMLAYAVIVFVQGLRAEKETEKKEERFVRGLGKREVYVFLGMVSSLILLDLAGDATELVTIVFVAQFNNLLLVFAGAVAALVAASAVETFLGSRLGRFLSDRNIRRLSVVVFLVIGSIIILSSGLVPM
jgi:putative Ca2+/H+ antiporter (TMEM165/GDT1 family)